MSTNKDRNELFCMSNQRSNLGTDVVHSNAVVIPTTHMRLPLIRKTNRGTGPWE